MEKFLTISLIGLLAQLIDGALGMAYGVTSTTMLLYLGLSPAIASASVHLSEIFTTGISGLSHIHFQNVCWMTVRRLAIPGTVGAGIGAYSLTSFPTEAVKPFVASYLLMMGGVILFKAIRGTTSSIVKGNLSLLGFFGGLLDSIGGGGWGPVVVSNLVSRGHEPRKTIGSANVAEFFVVLAASGTFVMTLGLDYWRVVACLAAGGVIAAPFAAYLCKILPVRTLMILVGVILISLNAWVLLR